MKFSLLGSSADGEFFLRPVSYNSFSPPGFPTVFCQPREPEKSKGGSRAFLCSVFSLVLIS